MTFTETFTVQALAPFNFDLTAQIFAKGDKQIRSYANGQFSQVLKVNGKLVLIRLTSTGTVEQPKIKVELKSNNPITLQDKRKAEEAAKFIFNLDFDLQSFYEDIKNDQTMQQITKQLYGLKNPTTPTVFEALADSIVEQQISIKVAQIIEVKLAKKFGETLTLNGDTYYAYPTPQSMACASIEEIRNCGLSQRKAEYIREAAKLIAEGKLDLEHLKNNKIPEQIIVELDEIRGIGVWTAELTMLRGMQKLDALPADDFGIRRVISRYYCNGKPIKSAEAREVAKSWGTWKGLAAYYLIVAEIKGITV
ncbi:DNA-3-methyladenine glycosylase [Candidatus Bathyarchaeota archaeon]|nr:DNA-3-methyladenine glycosylase [Candidatus Bathyarchaeota archaeon]